MPPAEPHALGSLCLSMWRNSLAFLLRARLAHGMPARSAHHMAMHEQAVAKDGRTTLALATRQTDAALARLSTYLCGSPADGSPATMLSTVLAFALAFDQSVRFIACQGWQNGSNNLQLKNKLDGTDQVLR